MSSVRVPDGVVKSCSRAHDRGMRTSNNFGMLVKRDVTVVRKQIRQLGSLLQPRHLAPGKHLRTHVVKIFEHRAGSGGHISSTRGGIEHRLL